MRKTMNDPGVFGPEQQGEDEPEVSKREPIDWKHVAPRWVIVSIATMMTAAVLVMGSMLLSEKNEEFKAVKQAQRDAPTIYQTRLAERVTVLEVEVDVIKAQNLRYNISMEKLTESMSRMATQLEVMNDREMKRRRAQ